jgi:hypothetical protein
VSAIQSILATLTVAATLLPAAIASGHGPQALARHCGFGWSDGYHSRTACPPRKGVHPKPCLTCGPVAPYEDPIYGSSATLLPHWDKMPQRWR